MGKKLARIVLMAPLLLLPRLTVWGRSYRVNLGGGRWSKAVNWTTGVSLSGYLHQIR